MEIIFLSPHLDDAALSCGALIWQQAQAGHQVQVWTLCAGDPPGLPSDFVQKLHQRWGLKDGATAQRRQEDKLACQSLTAGYRHYSLPDCIYRLHPESKQPLYASEEALFGDLAAADLAVMDAWAAKLATELPANAQIYSPLTLGGHVDHQLMRRIAEKLPGQLAYYADFPYVLKTGIPVDIVPLGYSAQHIPITGEALAAWQDSVACYVSQISTFWTSLDAMRKAIHAFAAQNQGVVTWHKTD